MTNGNRAADVERCNKHYNLYYIYDADRKETKIPVEAKAKAQKIINQIAGKQKTDNTDADN